TGLDPKKDAIIEIGAVKFNDRRVEDEWNTFIHPGRRIPPFITRLTGITDQMVLQALPINDVLAELNDFIQDAPIVGHNVRFDLAFLNRYSVGNNNDRIDTYELASVLLPNASRYNLSALAQALGVPFPATHRALDDARATRGIYQRLIEEAYSLPIDLLSEIIQLSEQVDWNGYYPLEMVLNSRLEEIDSPEIYTSRYQIPLFNKDYQTRPAILQPVETLSEINIEELTATLEPGGMFAQQFPQYEYRPQQVAMLEAVAEALTEQRHLLVEAGTGTGKSIAYLIPALYWALNNNRRVVISTNTINLQDQLINKDIPDLRKILGININAVVMKGRSNYICPRRLESLRHNGPENPEEMRILAKILVWLQNSENGDRAEINLNGPVERAIWSRVSAEDEGCTTENCLKTSGGACPFHRVRQEAQYAHLVIVNHALLLADVATGNRVLPEYEYLIADEAHHLEDATTNALSYRTNQADIRRTMRELGGPGSGILGWVLKATRDVLTPKDFAGMSQLVKQATDYAFRFENLSRSFFESVSHFMGDQRDGQPIGTYSHQERIVNATRTQPGWSDVELSWEEAERSLKPLVETISQIYQGLGELHEMLREADEELYSYLTNLNRRLTELKEHLNALVFVPAEDQIYWTELRANDSSVSLHAAPLHIGPLMQRFLWYEKSSVILTSATLTTSGDFDFIRGRLFAEDANELALGSPFDYENATMLYLVNDIAEPNNRQAYQRAVESGLIQLCRATGGRALVLFTSYDQLKRTSSAITTSLMKENIHVYEQGTGASPHALLESFREADKAVLLGTRSFWEGVDVPGEALSVLVIVRLPFNVPSEPITASRAATFEDPFYEYSLPEAILRLRQGFGRLIRTQYDRGIVAIFDSRIINKKYGHFFIDSLPTCTLRIAPMSNLPHEASKWLNL
ncbi:helicase C-terminal domain-containing protein, partial [Chloroflexota bacterium]